MLSGVIGKNRMNAHRQGACHFQVSLWGASLLFCASKTIGLVVEPSKPLQLVEKSTLVEPRIPRFPPWTEYLMDDRLVAIRMTNWCDNDGDVHPLQTFRAIGKTATSRQKQLNRGRQSPTPPAGEGEGGSDDEESLSLQIPTNTKLSRSSESMMQKFESLTPAQKGRLRQKIQKEHRASTPLARTKENLQILYKDDHICVTMKPSGILSVPGPRRNPSLAGLVYETIQPFLIDTIDQMIVHRLDMDTSGILVYALSKAALSKLHDDFRERRVTKRYQALVVGHIKAGLSEMEISLDLERDPNHPPFMRIAQPRSNDLNNEDKVTTGNPNKQQPQRQQQQGGGGEGLPLLKEQKRNSGFQKMIDKAAKPSLTTLQVLSWEYLGDDKHRYPVTRILLTPHTGRTHQLRVHTAAL